MAGFLATFQVRVQDLRLAPGFLATTDTVTVTRSLHNGVTSTRVRPSLLRWAMVSITRSHTRLTRCPRTEQWALTLVAPLLVIRFTTLVVVLTGRRFDAGFAVTRNVVVVRWGVVVTLLLAVPAPALLTARSWMPTGIPLVNPVMVIGLVVEPVGFHAPDPFNRYW